MCSDKIIACCPLCGKTEFNRLPSPWAHSMTTAGRMVQEPLAKAQCTKCGILQRVEIRQLGETNFYETQYSFYERPGAAKFDAPRYAAMADWIAEAIAPLVPEIVFDAGCGRGWMLEALSKRFPAASLEGVEPSEQESENARLRGLNVSTGRVGPDLKCEKHYDLVYSTNVLEHTTDPVQFLKTLRRLVSDTGFVVILCPDSSVPSAEFMFSDQNYSFTPSQLSKLAELAGLQPVSWSRRPEVPSLLDKQIMVFSKSGSDANVKRIVGESVSLEDLLKKRADYVASYQKCDDYLIDQLGDSKRINNFGTSTWSMLLAAYCPQYWKRVECCVIDGGYGEFMGKPVRDAKQMDFQNGGIVILGTNPSTQEGFAHKLNERGIQSIRWDHIVAR